MVVEGASHSDELIENEEDMIPLKNVKTTVHSGKKWDKETQAQRPML
jgi:hypothetical protein